MAKNASLGKAKSAKNDEFYTRLVDIENELWHYREHFRGKTVFCNCDDPFESNFFKHFVLNFNFLQLKKVIATSYEGSPIMGKQLSLFDITGKENDRKTPYKAIVTKVYDTTGDGGVNMLDVANLFKSGENELTELKGSGDFLAGDFRSDECVALLKEADIVSTNPPFSLFREYVAQLVEFGKKFVIIGSLNAIIYKDIFPLIKEDKMWLGYGFNGGAAYFRIPEYAAANYGKGVYDQQTGLVKFGNCMWYTNLDIAKRHEVHKLHRKYYGNEADYPRYDNYDAIEVSKINHIPCDYDGVMGVPVSFLDKYNPEQFELLGCNRGVGQDPSGVYGRGSMLNGKETFKRLFIRRRATSGN